MVRIRDRCADLAGRPPASELKHGDAFAVLDAHGDIGAIPGTAEGLFYRDTRYLSRFELRIEGRPPLFLAPLRLRTSRRSLSTSPIRTSSGVRRGCRVTRSFSSGRSSSGRRCAMNASRLGITEGGRVASASTSSSRNDFVDLFEVRGMSRAAPRERSPPGRRSRSGELALCAGSTESSGGHALRFFLSPARLEAIWRRCELRLLRRSQDVDLRHRLLRGRRI